MSDGAGTPSAGRGPLVGRGRETPAPAPVDGADPPRSEAPGADLAGAVPRPAFVEPRGWSPRGARLGLGIALVVGLGGAWIALAPRANPAAVAPTSRSTPAASTTTTAAAVPSSRPSRPSTPVPSWVPPAIAATCHARAATTATVAVVVDCTPGRGVAQLRYRAFTTVAALRAAYRARPSGRRGAPRCATGRPDERAWSTAALPDRTVGRFRCVLVEGRARIVWTDERARVLAVASRADGDLRSLYAWWTTVPGPVPGAPAR